MKNFAELSIFGILAFILSMCIIPVMKGVAQKLKLVDIPNSRKLHRTAIPLIGGLVIGIVVILLIAVSGLSTVKEIFPIVITSYIMLLVGALDDKNDIKATYKLGIQLGVSMIIAIYGVRITSLYGLFGIYDINLYMQYFLTVLIITTAVNAFNLIDGIDGLAGSVGGIGFVLLFSIAAIQGNIDLARMSILFIGSLIAFLRHNFSLKGKIFLGNSGALFLGYLLICLGIYITKFDHNVNHYPLGIIFILSIFLVPVIDSIRVYGDRILRGKSAFKADKTHIHHHLLDLGLSHKKITTVFILINILVLTIQIIFFRTYLIYTALLSFAVFIVIFKVIKIFNQFISWKKAIRRLENT